MGPIDPDAVPAFYATLDVLAVPSIPRPGWTEQFGRVAVEAMASGVPVVSSDAGALPDVVGGAGLVVPAGDATALATALVEAATTRAPELREAGLARAAECSWDAVAHAYADLYRSVTSRGARGTTEAAAAAAARNGTGGDPSDADRSRSSSWLSARRSCCAERSSRCEISRSPSWTTRRCPRSPHCATRVGVRYIDPGRNGGFAAGVNVALRDRLVPGADVLLLNPDAVISADAIAVLHDALAADRGLASVAPVQTDDRGRPARVAWPFPSPGNAWLEAVGLGRWQRGAAT